MSLVGALAFVNLLDFSINTLTLFAIVLATGIVVDDAIVVIENIERHIQEYGKAPLQAASDAMREVFGAVIATALVLIAVFVPVAFFPGHDRPPVSAVCADDCLLGRDFRIQRPDTDASAVGAAAPWQASLGAGWFFGPVERAIQGGHQPLRAHAFAA